jgi:hypothetical protein
MKNFIKDFIKDIFTEDKIEGKFSSKKTLGIIAGLLSFLAFIVDGFHFYEIDNDMFNTMLIFSATMLGASVIRNFTKGNNTK